MLIWKKSEPKVFNWSEFHFSEVTSYKIRTLACSFFVLISKVVQCHIEGGIDVYDRVTLKHLYRLNGHEYGGQCVELSGK